MKIKTFLFGFVLFAIAAFFASPAGKSDEAAIPNQPTYTVSGTIRHEGNPVAGVVVSVNWDSGGLSMTTGIDGTYSLNGIPSGDVMIFVRPPAAIMLAYRNWGGTLSGNLVKDFDLSHGYRLQGEFHKPDGTLYADSLWLEANAIDYNEPNEEWLGESVINGYFDLVLPPSRYLLGSNPQPIPYFMPRTKIDLRSGNMSGLVVTLVTSRPEALPTTPPDASMISVGVADQNGLATVAGLPGSVEPRSDVVVVNLNAKRLAHSIADSSGAFSLSLFAPSGSTLMVKYDPDGWRTQNLLDAALNSSSAVTYLDFNPLPGTMIQVGTPPEGQENYQDFAAVGGFVQDPNASNHGKWAGWWLGGKVQVPSGPPPLKINPGNTVTLRNLVLRVTSPVLNCSGTPTISVDADIVVRYLFAEDGHPYPTGMWFTSQLFTPTGLPIEHEASGESQWVKHIRFDRFTCDGSEAAYSASLDTSFTFPDSLPVGTYQIQASLYTNDVPQADVNQAPFVIVWYHFAWDANLPILTVGNAQPPHIPWTLLGDYPIDGRRGVGALEDAGIYSMPDRVITAPERYIVPRLDARTGEPLIYRLEPGSHWLSATDRRFPNPPRVPLKPVSGELEVTIEKPDGEIVVLGPAMFTQTSQRTPATRSGHGIAEGTGQICDLYHLTTRDSTFDYSFEQYGPHVITLSGQIKDIYGRSYEIDGTYDIEVARVLDIDPAQLPTTPYVQGDAFAPGLHVFPPVPAEVSVKLTHMPYSDLAQAFTTIVSGQANKYGYFQPPPRTEIRFEDPGEFRVDINAVYTDTDGTLWAGSMTWGNVVESTSPMMEAHGRRGMDYHTTAVTDTIDDMPTWFTVNNLPAKKIGIENYYPYWSGDIHWGNEDKSPGDSIHSIITINDLSYGKSIFNLMYNNYPRSNNGFRWPPDDTSQAGLLKRMDIGEAPLFISTVTGKDAGVFPEQIDQFAYWYGSSERPDLHVREIISEDNMGTAYWRFNDTYNMQIGEGALGDLPGDLKWEFGGAVFRMPGLSINEYAVYSSLWVLLPHDDPVGARVTPPFQYAAGGSINGGPIMNLQGQDINMLFLPKGVRPGDILERGDTIAFSGHVGPPLDSRVEVTITPPSGSINAHSHTWHANKIGWLYDPSFDFVANVPGRWTVDVAVEHDRPYLPTGVTPTSFNTGTVLGTTGRYEFYVVEPGAPRLFVFSPKPGFVNWPSGQIEPIHIRGSAPPGTAHVYYTIHDKGVVMGQGIVFPDASRTFTVTYDANALNVIFPFVSLTAHEGRWEGLADEVEINLLAVGDHTPQANTVTLIGEEVFLGNKVETLYLPLVRR